MTVSTVDHIGYIPETLATPIRRSLTVRDLPDADEAHIRALSADGLLRPDPDARARIADLVYQITGWETFAYVGLAASETEAEAEEHRQILRRRRPPWADED